MGRGSISAFEGAGQLHHSSSELREESSQRTRRSSFSNSQASCKVQGEGQGCPGSRECLSKRDVACPRQEFDYVPVAHPSSGSPLPGERASTVVTSAVANSMFRWAIKTRGAFRNFLLSIVAKPKDDNLRPTSKRGGEMHLPVWPMPVPYPEVFTKKVDSEKDWKKNMICMEVLA